MSKKKISILVGSLRQGSYSRIIANKIKDINSESLEFEFIDISELPIYNEDFDEKITEPASYQPFREKVKNSDAFLFVTPEYNRSVPAVLKNALDVGSRPANQSVWQHKPGAIISVSPGAIGGFGANHHLRQTLSFLNIYMMQQPEMYLGNIINSIDDESNVSERTTKFLTSFVTSLEQWIEKF